MYSLKESFASPFYLGYQSEMLGIFLYLRQRNLDELPKLDLEDDSIRLVEKEDHVKILATELNNRGKRRLTGFLFFSEVGCLDEDYPGGIFEISGYVGNRYRNKGVARALTESSVRYMEKLQENGTIKGRSLLRANLIIPEDRPQFPGVQRMLKQCGFMEAYKSFWRIFDSNQEKIDR